MRQDGTLEIWQVRLRYADERGLPMSDRLDTATWLDQVLPQTGALGAVSALPRTNGWTVLLHVQATARVQASEIAETLIEEVVGDTPRVLGRLVEQRISRVRVWP